MAFIGIHTPHETARLLHTIKVPGTREDVSSSHITLLHLGKDVPIEQLGKAIISAYKVASEWKPFLVSTKKVSSFAKDGEGDIPIICLVDSSDLHSLQVKLKQALDKEGIEYSKKFKSYIPHVTLAYSEENFKDRAIPRIEWAAHEMTLWGGDDGDDRLSCTFPFSIHPTKEAVTRSVIRAFTRKKA